MIETYIYKTLISFVVLNAVMFITKENWLKLKSKKNGFIKRNIFKLAWCLIPVVRWLFIAIVLMVGIALGNDKYYQEIKNRLGENEYGND